MSEVKADYDNPWKEALSEYFEPFLQFFFPQVHALIDWSRTPQPLDKELQQIAPASDVGLRVADKLYQVWQLNNQPAWILIHVEVQSQEQTNFARRMYIYNYRAFDLYEQPVISLAVLGDEQASWRPSHYGYSLGGCEVSLKFPIVKLLDYQAQWEELEQSDCPFAIIVMAHLKTKATTSQFEERERWKWRIVRGLYERGYQREAIIKIFQMIDRMMTLPQELQQSFEEKLNRYEEERTMPLMSNMELRGMERGSIQTARESVIAILQLRLEELPSELIEALNNVSDLQLLKQLLLQAANVNTFDEFQRSFQQKLNRYEEEKTMPLMSNMELRAATRNARESVMTVLSLRFGELPSDLVEALNNISDLQLLKQLLEPAVTVNTLNEFQQAFSDARSVN